MISDTSEASENSKKINKKNRTCTWPWRSTSLQKQAVDSNEEKGEVIATPYPPLPVFPTPSKPGRSGRVFPRALHLDISAAQAYGSKQSTRHERSSRKYKRIASLEEPITFEPLLLRDTDAPFLSPLQKKKNPDNREYDQWSSPNEAKHFPQDLGDEEPDCLMESPINLSEKDIEQPSAALAPRPSLWKIRAELGSHSPMTPMSTTSLDSSITLVPSPSSSHKTQRRNPPQPIYLKRGGVSQQRRREVSVYGSMIHGMSGEMEGGGSGSVLRGPAAVDGDFSESGGCKHKGGKDGDSKQKRHDSKDENPFVIGDSESEE